MTKLLNGQQLSKVFGLNRSIRAEINGFHVWIIEARFLNIAVPNLKGNLKNGNIPP